METVCMYQREASLQPPHFCRTWELSYAALTRHSSLRHALVLQGGMALLHEISSTATHVGAATPTRTRTIGAAGPFE